MKSKASHVLLFSSLIALSFAVFTLFVLHEITERSDSLKDQAVQAISSASIHTSQISESISTRIAVAKALADFLADQGVDSIQAQEACSKAALESRFKHFSYVPYNDSTDNAFFEADAYYSNLEGRASIYSLFNEEGRFLVISVPVIIKNSIEGIIYCAMDSQSLGLDKGISRLVDSQGRLLEPYTELLKLDNWMEDIPSEAFADGASVRDLKALLGQNKAASFRFRMDGKQLFAVLNPIVDIGIESSLAIISVNPMSYFVEKASSLNNQHLAFLVIILAIVLVMLIICIQAVVMETRQRRSIENSFDALASSISSGLIEAHYIDGEVTVAYANDRFFKLIGYDREQFRLEVQDPISLLPSEERQAVRKQYELLCQQGGTYCFPSIHIRLRDGGQRTVKLTAAFIDKHDRTFHLALFSDMTTQLDAAKSYQQTIDSKAAESKTIIGSARLNLTRDVLLSEPSNYLKLISRTDNVDDFLSACISRTEDKSMGKVFSSVLNRKNLLESYENGIAFFKEEFKINLQESSRSIWCRTTINTARNPMTDDIEAVMVVMDIDTEVRLSQVNDWANRQAFDYLGYVEVATQQCTFYGGKIAQKHYTALINEDASAIPDLMDKKSYIESMAFENVIAILDADKPFELRCQFAEGPMKRIKTIRICYLDSSRDCLVIARSDDTDAVSAEKMRNDMLATALSNAKSAYEAKSKLTSRISFDIRNPLNSIMGYLNLAKTKDDKQAYIEKALAACGQLCRVMTSTLSADSASADQLSDSPFSLSQTLLEVIREYRSLCRSKEVSFRTSVDPRCSDQVFGRKAELVNILSNILSYSLNKTPPRSKMELEVSQQGLSDQKQDLVVRISFTCPSMHLDSSILDGVEANDEGQAFGLPAARSMAEKLGGQLEFSNEKAGEPAFTLFISLLNDSQRLGMPEYQNLKLLSIMNPSMQGGLEWILGKLKIKGRLASSLNEALHACKISKFDLVIADESAAKGMTGIRALQPNAILIAFCDYPDAVPDADEILESPFFASTFLDVLDRRLKSKQTRAAKPADGSFGQNLKGRTILVAEGSAMNMEIAVEILKAAGMNAVQAIDGEQALNQLSTSPTGYFDAILMDVQMPKVNGLEATRAIRAMDRPDAALIPIIAMTAGTMRSDIKKVYEAGMNEHLAKPFSPEALIKMLASVVTPKSL